MSSNLGFAILGRFKFKRFHSWWYDLSSTCNQRLLSEFYLQNALSSDVWFCLHAIFPDSPFKGGYIYIFSLECCLRENVREDLQYKWYPMPFFHIWSIWHEIFGQENSKRSISSIHLGVFLDLAQLETAKLQNYFFLRFYCSSIPRKSVSSKSNFSAISPSQSVS